LKDADASEVFKCRTFSKMSSESTAVDACETGENAPASPVALEEAFSHLSQYRIPSDRLSDRVRIGRGAFSQCCSATDTSTGKKVCLSLLHEVRAEDPKPLVREIECLAGNAHPTVLNFIGFSIDSSNALSVGIVTEFQEKGDLESALDHGGLNATEKSKAIFGIVCGMAYLHSRGLLHRDLKPSAVLLNGRSEPVIGGFGVSRFYEQGLELSYGVGTPLYMAPEIMSDEESYGFPVDVFAFAVTLYAIFARPDSLDDDKGKIKTAHGLFRRVLAGARLVKPPEIPEYHWGVITRCWKGNAQERPTFAALLNEFHGSHEYILSGADRSVVLEYEDRVYSDFGSPKPRAQGE
jgi:serine/threonine protein kinase